MRIETISVPSDIVFTSCAKASRLSHRQKKTDFTLKEDIYFLQRLMLIGDSESKSLRGLVVHYELTVPRYFWHEFVTYRIGNEQLGSESTMHSAPKFETEEEFLTWKREYKEGNEQTRIFMTSYPTLRRMYFDRRHHKLTEWKELCKWIENLPYAQELITMEKDT